MDNRQLLQAAREWAARNYPGCQLKALTVRLHGLPKISLPAAPCPVPEVAPAPAAATGDFEPNDYQTFILEALEYKALRSDALVAELEHRGANGDRRRLWKKDGIKELLAAGWVLKDDKRQMGYYRPDMPPLELAEGGSAAP